MVALVEPDEGERYLLAILDAPDGIDLAEFAVHDPRNDDGCYRLYDYQWPWFACRDTYQIDMGGRNTGKELALDTPVPTPSGWTSMGKIEAGDRVFDEQGRPCTVTEAHDVVHGLDCYRLTFSDGEQLVASGRHRWLTWDKAARKAAQRRGSGEPAVRTTSQIQASLTVGKEANHSIPIAQPLELPDRELPLDPWVLGYWLGNGTKTQPYVTIGDTDFTEIEAQFLARGYAVRRLTTKERAPALRFDPPDGNGRRALEQLGLIGDKHIPGAYLRGSAQQRADLLAGIVDSDGHLPVRGGQAEVTFTIEELAYDLVFLLRTLGEQPHIHEGRATIAGIDKGAKWRITWTPIRQPALLARKAANWRSAATTRVTHRRIVAVDPVPSVPVRCISVDSPSHLYLVGEGLIPTHNTESVKLRALAFPFVHAGKSMLLTAPELNHLRPLTDEVEKMLLGTRIVREMMPKEKSAGIARQPHWQVRFRNGASLISRLPNKDGKGVKGCVAGSRPFIPAGAPADAEPMLIPGALILTRRGNMPVEDVVVGDEVFTHMGRWRPVTATFHSTAAPTVEVAGAGHRGLIMSETHSMYARRNRNPQRTRNLEPPLWLTPACEGAEGHPNRWYFGSPTVVADVEMPWTPHPDGASLLALAGAYVADGCPLRDAILITDHEDEMPRLEAIAEALGLGYGIYDHSTLSNRAKRFAVHESGVGRWFCEWIVNQFGSGAAGKHVPVWLLGAPEHMRKAFLDAYMAGDGHWDPVKGRWTVSSASKELIIGLRLLGQTLGYNCNYSWVDPKVTHIMGVELKKAPQRSHRLTLTASGRNAVVEDGISWQKVRSVTSGPECDVYDLAVEEDHSYIADGLISHNQHVVNLEMDESQDYPQPGWREVVECLNAGDPDAVWRCHGVSRGVRDSFFEKTQPGSGWRVHRPMAMNRPSWSKVERDAKIVEYGGSRQSVDYRRNIYGEHGDASNSVFVLAKLMAIVDLDEGSTYNTDVYAAIKMAFERFPTGAGDDERASMIDGWLQVPAEHFHGYSQRVANREVGSPRGYSAYWGGMDVGVTNHPSEILIFGQRTGSEFLELLLRVHMQRINTDDQLLVVSKLFEIYGANLRLGIDKTGVGFMLWDQLTRRSFGERIYGFGFSEKRVVAIEDRPLTSGESVKDLAKMRNVVEASTDWLRNDYVDARRIRLPYDREVLIEWQGQTYSTVRDNGDPYGVRRQYSGGSFHTLDAAKVAIATINIPVMEEMLGAVPTQTPVFDVFMGA